MTLSKLFRYAVLAAFAAFAAFGCGGATREPAPELGASAAFECAEIASCDECAVFACGSEAGDRYEARVQGAVLSWSCAGVASCSAAQHAAAEACGVSETGACR